MADRDMSYALDGAFSTRNQGQIVSALPVQQASFIRSPGLVKIANPTTKVMRTGTPRPMPMAGLSDPVNIPIFGQVKMGHLLAIAGVAAVAGILLFKTSAKD